MKSIRDRVKARMVEANGCWEWQGHIPLDGYGRIRWEGRQWLAHRAAYSAFVGPIPEGMDLDHLCRNRRCVNPQHVEPVTRSENLKRSPLMDRQGHKTHCPKGHEYSDENTERRNGRRHCRACSRARWDVERHNPMAPCPDCGKEMRRGNIKRHKREACRGGE